MRLRGRHAALAVLTGVWLLASGPAAAMVPFTRLASRSSRWAS
ncbi:MAG TPA: hypothetical protein VG846_10725 [Actinomycetota bacterium]|nr:hypothetical protein [Actinomycetota bacterium]